jgi:DNA-binding NtrC family response regulator
VGRRASQPWPGNVRELRNHVERAAGLGRSAASGSEIDVSMPLKEARNRWVQLFESRYLAELLHAHGGNVSAAARAAGIDRVHFYRLLGRAGLR